MFYDAVANDHGLKYDPFKALIVPRPIGWVTSLDREGGVNLAPYSFFNALASRPNIVGFSSGGRKDSVANIEETGEFVCNLATWDLREAMNATSAEVPSDVDEMALAGLGPAPSRMVRPPRVAASPVALECRYLQSLEFRDIDGNPTSRWMVIGQVVGVHVDDSLVVDGRIDITRARPLARLGYMDYAVIEDVFAMGRPKP